jgi:hypothetical protein
MAELFNHDSLAYRVKISQMSHGRSPRAKHSFFGATSCSIATSVFRREKRTPLEG